MILSLMQAWLRLTLLTVYSKLILVDLVIVAPEPLDHVSSAVQLPPLSFLSAFFDSLTFLIFFPAIIASSRFWRRSIIARLLLFFKGMSDLTFRIFNSSIVLSMAGVLHHIVNRSTVGQKLFYDHDDCSIFLQSLYRIMHTKPFTLYAFCLMIDHVHLLIEIEASQHVGKIVQALLTSFTKSYRARHGGSGHLFGSRYTSILCQKDILLADMVSYIHLNPKRAGYVRDLREWPWSSHHEYLQERQLLPVSTGWLGFPRDPKRTRENYEELMKRAPHRHRPEFYPSRSRPFLGNDRFVEYWSRMSAKKTSAPKPLLSLQDLANNARVDHALLASESRNRLLSHARKKFILKALKLGHRPLDIAQFLRKSASTVSKVIARDFKVSS